MSKTSPKILILEADPSASNVLKIGVNKHMPGDVITVATIEEAIGIISNTAVDVAIINHSIGQDTFSRCYRLKSLSNTTQIVVLCAPGKELKKMEEMQSYSDEIDNVLDKPLRFPKLKFVIDQHLSIREDVVSEKPQSFYDKFLPANIRSSSIEVSNGDAFMSERTVLVTDIRRSTQIINQANLEDFFSRINEHFTRMGELVTQFRGEVIKYTGDGMLACFEGFGRQQLALKCAIAIAEAEKKRDKPFELGIGVSDGLVMNGFIGSESRVFYDLIGKNVNLAYRLCEQASPHEIIYSNSMHRAGANTELRPRQLSLQLMGFEEPTQCYSLFSNTEET